MQSYILKGQFWLNQIFKNDGSNHKHFLLESGKRVILINESHLLFWLIWQPRLSICGRWGIKQKRGKILVSQTHRNDTVPSISVKVWDL